MTKEVTTKDESGFFTIYHSRFTIHFHLKGARILILEGENRHKKGPPFGRPIELKSSSMSLGCWFEWLRVLEVLDFLLYSGASNLVPFDFAGALRCEYISNKRPGLPLKAGYPPLLDLKLKTVFLIHQNQQHHIRRAEGEKVRRLEGGRGELSYLERERLGQVRQKQVFYGFVIGLMILGIFFSQSRGGIIGSVISLTVLIAVSKKMRTRGMLFLVLGSWAVMLVYGGIIGFDNILRRFDQIELGAEGRFQIWRTAMAIISDHPWVGTGLGSFGDLFRVCQDFLDDKMTSSFAHNDYLHLTVELGIPAAALLVLLAWGYWWRGGPSAWREARGEGQRGGRLEDDTVGGLAARNSAFGMRYLLSVGALARAAAFLCHAWVEFNWHIPANALYFVTLLVLMRGEKPRMR